jgi:hypothetical protein
MAQLVKSVRGLAIASCKSFRGLAIASAKSLNGLDNTASGASYIIDQNFETATTGYDNSESWTEAGTGTVEAAQTSGPILGSQSLNIITSAQTGSTFTSLGSAIANFYVFMRLRINSWNAASQSLAFIRTSGASDRATLQLTATRLMRVLNAGGTLNASTDVVPLSTDIYVWFEYEKGSGVNAIARFGWSSDGTKPTITAAGAKTGESTNGTGVADTQRLYLGNDSSCTYDITFDHVLVDDVTIGSNP